MARRGAAMCLRAHAHIHAPTSKYTSARPIFDRFPTIEETTLKNAAMPERFKIRHWHVPIPHGIRRHDFPRCGRCFAEFMLGS